MKACLVSISFDKEAAQGTVKVAHETTRELEKKIKCKCISNNNFTSFQNNIIYAHTTLPIQLINKKADVYHFFMPELIPGGFISRKKPIIVTVHDALTKTTNDRKMIVNKYYDYVIGILSKKADAIITVSNYSKESISKEFNIPKEKIHVVYNGINHKLFKPIKKIKKNYVGYIGGLGKRKNVEKLIESIKYIDDKLIIVGKGNYKKILENHVAKLNLKNKIKFVDFIEEKNLPKFYNSIKLLAFPSLAEGFGLTIIEAMACGCPVVTSNRTSMPEICGKAAIYFNPEDPKEIAKKINQVLNNKALQIKLSKSGIKQSKKFNWKNAAKETIKIYNKVSKKYK